MRRVISSLAVIIGVLAFAPLSPAQSLGELAAREKEKRKARTGKVYSDEDLRSRAASRAAESSASSDTSTAAAAEGAAPAADASAEDQQRAEKDRAWRERRDTARAALDAAKAEQAKAEEAFNAAPDQVKNSFRTRLDETKQKVLEAQQAVDKIEDERRFGGVAR
jgi:hypothetical protein